MKDLLQFLKGKFCKRVTMSTKTLNPYCILFDQIKDAFLSTNLSEALPARKPKRKGSILGERKDYQKGSWRELEGVLFHVEDPVHARDLK